MQERVEQFSRNTGDRFAVLHISNEDGELIAADARDRIGRAQTALQTTRDRGKQRVAE